jgi:tetratricopeptide (TPR) repeat protein
MHRGVQEFIAWIESNPDFPGVRMNPPAQAAELAAFEQQLGAPLPADLRLVMTRFNGGLTPSGRVLSIGGQPDMEETTTIDGNMHRLAERLSRSWSDPELMLPFFQTDDGGLLAFDRSAAPLSDTWPIVDYYVETGDLRLVYRTFDGWCRHCIAEWTAPDFQAPFTVDKYLAQGKRHAAIEADVSTAHATVAHAYRRAGEPELALDAYFRAARCVPALPWCDWEALKIAALLGNEPAALEAAGRLCTRAPRTRWAARETQPAKVADVIGGLAACSADRDAWLRLLDQLDEQAEDEDARSHIQAVRRAVFAGRQLPPPRSWQAGRAWDQADASAAWRALCQAYAQGELRDEDLLLDPSLAEIRAQRRAAAVLRIRRDF